MLMQLKLYVLLLGMQHHLWLLNCLVQGLGYLLYPMKNIYWWFPIATHIRLTYFSIPCSFVSRIFDHALEHSQSKSSLVNSLSVCISLLDPKRSMPPIIYSFRTQQMQEPPVQVSSETVDAMLPKLGNLCISFVFLQF